MHEHTTAIMKHQSPQSPGAPWKGNVQKASAMHSPSRALILKCVFSSLEVLEGDPGNKQGRLLLHGKGPQHTSPNADWRLSHIAYSIFRSQCCSNHEVTKQTSSLNRESGLPSTGNGSGIPRSGCIAHTPIITGRWPGHPYAWCQS